MSRRLFFSYRKHTEELIDAARQRDIRESFGSIQCAAGVLNDYLTEVEVADIADAIDRANSAAFAAEAARIRAAKIGRR